MNRSLATILFSSESNVSQVGVPHRFSSVFNFISAGRVDGSASILLPSGKRHRLGFQSSGCFQVGLRSRCRPQAAFLGVNCRRATNVLEARARSRAREAELVKRQARRQGVLGADSDTRVRI